MFLFSAFLSFFFKSTTFTREREIGNETFNGDGLIWMRGGGRLSEDSRDHYESGIK